MTIKKVTGKTEEEAIEKAKQELGPDVVIMNVRTVKQKSFLGVFGKVFFEVTAAVEEEPGHVKTEKTEQMIPMVHENINMAADEPIKIPPLENDAQKQAKLIADTVKKIQPILEEQQGIKQKQTKSQMPQEESAAMQNEMSEDYSQALAHKKNPSEDRVKAVEERIENLQSMIGRKISQDDALHKNGELPDQYKENLRFIKMIYQTMLENEVSEKYANQIIDEIDNVMRSSISMDYILSNIYQKMILKFGQSPELGFEGKKPKVLFFIGPTGVGKTTTIAKLASRLKVEQDKKIAFLTADTYRIAATEQLMTYANILNAPMTVIYSEDELNEAVKKASDYDVVLVDTAGFSHKAEQPKNDVRALIQNLDSKYNKEVYLLLSATTKYNDLLEIADTYKEIADYKLIFTKLDETVHYGNLLNMKLYTGTEIAFTTDGQNVPEDIQRFNSQSIVKHLLGGK